MDQLEKFLEELFTKKISYALPIKAKETIVKIAPWITLIVIVLSLPAIFALLGIGSFALGIGAMSSRYYIGVIVLIIQVVLMIMAFPGLQKRQIKGWKMVYYSDLVSAVYALFSAYSFGDLIWSLLGTCIGLYLLFQVKSYYK
jgi:hypothetical protein